MSQKVSKPWDSGTGEWRSCRWAQGKMEAIGLLPRATPRQEKTLTHGVCSHAYPHNGVNLETRGCECNTANGHWGFSQLFRSGDKLNRVCDDRPLARRMESLRVVAPSRRVRGGGKGGLGPSDRNTMYRSGSTGKGRLDALPDAFNLPRREQFLQSLRPVVFVGIMALAKSCACVMESPLIQGCNPVRLPSLH